MATLCRAGFVGLCLWLLLGTVRISPFFLAYFNEFIGGPTNGHRYLIDSNIDWGQDLKGLAAYLARDQVSGVRVAYFGPRGASLRMYGLSFEPLWRGVPATGTIAISVNHLQGSSSLCDTPYEWLKRFAPIAKIGYSIFIYDIPESQKLPSPMPLPPECPRDPNPMPLAE